MIKKILKIIKLFGYKKKDLNYLKDFIKDYYGIKKEMPQKFYELFRNKLQNSNFLSLFLILKEENIYKLIANLKRSEEYLQYLEKILTPQQYFSIPVKHIIKIEERLSKLLLNSENNFNCSVKEEPQWLLRRIPTRSKEEKRILSYKLYSSIGLENTLEILDGFYGQISYEQIYYIFSKLNIKREKSVEEKAAISHFLFDNKKNYNNIFRQILNGQFNQLFLNFDYFFNNINYFLNKIGNRLSRDKVNSLLEERFLSFNPSLPQITQDIADDMLSSYYCRYETQNTPKEEIFSINFATYNQYLKDKKYSSIPRIDLLPQESMQCEVLKLNDPRNLVMGYRAGNCFRINGDASILFKKFLESEHMRILSVSTPDCKDYAMMLIMRNGNVLIGQGIEVSKRVSSDIKGKKLYETCRNALKEIMEYMNENGDEIVATIIGRSNSNVADYNNQILPFLIPPIIENSTNYYNGIANYQCLLDLSPGKSLSDINLYKPCKRYSDEREEILRRTSNIQDDIINQQLERRLRALRFARLRKDNGSSFYHTLTANRELYTCCNSEWYITLFSDGTIDSFIENENDERAQTEYQQELQKVHQKKKEHT